MSQKRSSRSSSVKNSSNHSTQQMGQIDNTVVIFTPISCYTVPSPWASGSYKDEYCRGSPVFNTPPPNGVGWWGVGYRTASTVLMLVTPRGPWFTYSSTYNLHRATPVLAKLPYCSMPNNWVYQYIRRIRLYLSEGKIMILIMIVYFFGKQSAWQ